MGNVEHEGQPNGVITLSKTAQTSVLDPPRDISHFGKEYGERRSSTGIVESRFPNVLHRVVLFAARIYVW